MATSGRTVLRTMGEVGGSGPPQLPLWPLLNPRCLLAWGSLLGRVVPTPGVSKAGLDWIYLQEVTNHVLTVHPEQGPRVAGRWEAACSVNPVRTGEQVHREAQTLLLGLTKSFVRVKAGGGGQGAGSRMNFLANPI